MLINKLAVISVLLLIIIIKYQIHSLTLQSFYWNQTTFRPYQDDSLIFEVRLGDVMDLICPYYDEQQSYMSNELEQYDIYHVAKHEYDLCNIDQFNMDPITRLIISCDSPYVVMKYTLNFRSYLPIPNGLEFHLNQTYYFLSTSITNQQCKKLKIIVHDHNRISSTFNENERKLFPYSHHRLGSSFIDKNIDYNDNHRLLPHIIKAQRHSDPYSIKWITEGPNQVKNSDKPFQSTNPMDPPILPANMLTLALSSSSSSKLSISFIIVILLLLSR